MYRSESARLKSLLAESSPQAARRLNHAKARAMMQTIGTVLDAANGQERPAVVQQLFDRVWLEREKTHRRPSDWHVCRAGGGGGEGEHGDLDWNRPRASKLSARMLAAFEIALG